MSFSDGFDEGQAIMSETERWVAKCQSTEDGTGDIIIELPPELLDQMGLGIGDDLELTVANGTIVLTPMHNVTSVLPMFAGPCWRVGNPPLSMTASPAAPQVAPC